MATTSPDNIWTPDSGDDYALTVDLAAMADTVQDALNEVHDVLDPLAEDSGWVPLPLQSGWSSGEFGDPPERRDYRGHTFLRGVVRRTTGNITSAGTIATLPVGSGPSAVSYFLSQGGGLAVVPVQINADGAVTVKAAPSVTTPWLSLDGIRIDH